MVKHVGLSQDLFKGGLGALHDTRDASGLFIMARLLLSERCASGPWVRRRNVVGLLGGPGNEVNRF